MSYPTKRQQVRGNDTRTLPRRWWRPGFVAENPFVGGQNTTLLMPSGIAEMDYHEGTYFYMHDDLLMNQWKQDTPLYCPRK
jgi:hypothetical protein